MNGDRELLELAAKAAGLRLEWDGHPDKWQPMFYQGKTYHEWDPLTNDGDALRLAVAMSMTVYSYPPMSGATITTAGASDGYHGSAQHDGDPRAATRRAIVKAAAAYGRTL